MSFSDMLYPHQVAAVTWTYYEGWLDETSVEYWAAVAEFNPFITDMAKYMLDNKLPWPGLLCWREAIDETAKKYPVTVQEPQLSMNDSRDYRLVNLGDHYGEIVTLEACQLVDLAKELIRHKQGMENL